MAISNDGRSRVLPALIVALCLLIGLSAAGYLVGRGATRFRSDTRVVTVKGLVEREVKADRAVWALGLRRASETLADDESAPFSQTSTPLKRIRVVSTFEFELR